MQFSAIKINESFAMWAASLSFLFSCFLKNLHQFVLKFNLQIKLNIST